MLTEKEEKIIEEAFFRGRMFETTDRDLRPELEDAIKKTKKLIYEKVKLSTQVEGLINLLTDSENQPHQYVSNPDKLRERLEELRLIDD